jgi:predicted lactoylglutathione lyase
MATKVFVNLPVKNVAAATHFFTQLGFNFNPQFSDEKATCLVMGDNIFAMLLAEDYFKTFTKKAISDATKTTEVLIAIDTATKEELQRLVQKAEELGGSIYAEPQDHGWMYQHSFADLDGHQWELMYMDQGQLPAE